MKILIYFLILSSLAHGVQRDWQKINEKNGISSYSLVIPGSKLVAVKGDSIINGPAEKLYAVLIDDEHLKDWVDRLKVSKVLENVSDKEDVMYQEYDLPWPLKNRDFVFRGKVYRDLQGKVHLEVKSEDHPNAPPSAGVRGETYGEYIITPLGKDKCKLEIEIFSDPKGKIPKWLINYIQKDWPYETISSIEKQMEMAYYREVPLPNIEENPKSILR